MEAHDHRVDAMKWMGAAVVLALWAALAPSQLVGQEIGSGPRIDARIDSLVAPAVNSHLFSGVILIARGDEPVYHRAFGHANHELDVSAATTHRFGIGSLNKALTEIIVQQLVREGRLDLEARVEDFIADFPRGPDGGVATVGHLYAHRSGTPHRVTTPEEEAFPLSTRDVVDRVVERGLLFEPGGRRLYSSAGFTVLARIIEIVEGKPFDGILAERIFEPAGMRLATSETTRMPLEARASPYKLGTDGRQVVVVNAPPKNLRFLTGAGSVYATAEDLLRFLRALHDGTLGEGLWNLAVDADAETWRGWAGRTGGYEAYMDVLPVRDLSFIMVTNIQSEANWQLRDRLRALLLGGTPEPIELPPPVAAEFEPPESLVGTYDNDGSPVVVTFREGHLFRGDNEFYPIDGRRYYTLESSSIVSFRRDASGVVDAMLWTRGDGEEFVLPRVR